MGVNAAVVIWGDLGRAAQDGTARGPILIQIGLASAARQRRLDPDQPRLVNKA
jgi:hypothetical protein